MEIVIVDVILFSFVAFCAAVMIIAFFGMFHGLWSQLKSVFPKRQIRSNKEEIKLDKAFSVFINGHLWTTEGSSLICEMGNNRSLWLTSNNNYFMLSPANRNAIISPLSRSGAIDLVKTECNAEEAVGVLELFFDHQVRRM